MRLFVAINFPESLRQGLWSATESLRSAALPVRWVQPERMHLTLKFLGEVAADRQDELADALGRVAGSCRAVTVTVAEFGAFPDARRPRVLWAGVSPEPGLELLQHQESVLHLRAAEFDIAGFNCLDGTVQIARQDVVEHDHQVDGAGVAYCCFLIRELVPLGVHVFKSVFNPVPV